MVQVGCDLRRDRVDGRGRAGARRSCSGAVAIHPNEAVRHAGVRRGRARRARARGARTTSRSTTRSTRVAPRSRAATTASAPSARPAWTTSAPGPRGRAVQREAFRAHIALAKELGLALQIHDRDAHDEVVEVLLADGAPDRTVFHCFSGDAALARLAVAHGWFLSFAGPVSFGPNDELRGRAARGAAEPAARRDRRAVPDRAPVPRPPERAVPAAGHGPHGRRGDRAAAGGRLRRRSRRRPRRSTGRGEAICPDLSTARTGDRGPGGRISASALGHGSVTVGAADAHLDACPTPQRAPTRGPPREPTPRSVRRSVADSVDGAPCGSSPRPPCSPSSRARPARSPSCTRQVTVDVDGHAGAGRGASAGPSGTCSRAARSRSATRDLVAPAVDQPISRASQIVVRHGRELRGRGRRRAARRSGPRR